MGMEEILYIWQMARNEFEFQMKMIRKKREKGKKTNFYNPRKKIQ